MNLTIDERFVLAGLLPSEESYNGMTEIARLKMHLILSDEEATTIKLAREGNGVRWDSGAAAQVIKDIPIGEWLTNVIREILRDKSDKHKLSEREMSLYEKFIVDYGMVG